MLLNLLRILISIVLFGTPIFSTVVVVKESPKISVAYYNEFLSYRKLNPGFVQAPMEFTYYKWSGSSSFQKGIRSVGQEANTQEPAMTLPPLFYPSPFRLAEGSTLGYQLNRSDMDVELRIYDIRGNEIYRKDLPHTGQGGLLGYNYVPFNETELGHSNMPAGVYFYVLLHEQKILGKGKFALLP